MTHTRTRTHIHACMCSDPALILQIHTHQYLSGLVSSPCGCEAKAIQRRASPGHVTKLKTSQTFFPSFLVFFIYIFKCIRPMGWASGIKAAYFRHGETFCSGHANEPNAEVFLPFVYTTSFFFPLGKIKACLF